MKLIILVVICIISVCNAAPKIDNVSWNNVIEVGSDLEINSSTSGRSSGESLQDFIENYIKSNDVSFKVPFASSTLTISGRQLDNEEIGIKLKFGSGREVEARKKSKIKKIFVPILIFILIKAITLIPLALGVLGLKTLNATQLSFVSFITALAMAVWKLCTKVNGDHQHPQIIHESYDPHHHHHIAAARADEIQGMNIAYNGQIPTQY
ncbi:hypothetical protein ABEB36_008910 [Hypothenemus hampei]|uniref:Osiris 19 n=1 Tax=Hypothenemus hampei TaxID=57062 RepID=A0ABD1ENH1_HYPHA